MRFPALFLALAVVACDAPQKVAGPDPEPPVSLSTGDYRLDPLPEPILVDTDTIRYADGSVREVWVQYLTITYGKLSIDKDGTWSSTWDTVLEWGTVENGIEGSQPVTGIGGGTWDHSAGSEDVTFWVDRRDVVTLVEDRLEGVITQDGLTLYVNTNAETAELHFKR